MKGYPAWFSTALYLTLLVLLASGALLAPGTLVMKAEWDLAWRLPGEARVWTAAAHALFGFAAMMFTGALWSIHMRAGWRRGKQRASGLMVAIGMLLLCVSAVLIYYLGDEVWGARTAVFHLVLGGLLVLPFGWHWLRRRA